MRKSCFAVALSLLATPVLAQGAGVVRATSSERDSAFTSLADCQKALGGAAASAGKDEAGSAVQSGSLFNRAAGNLSRCETFEGEFLIVVYPNPRTLPDAD